MYTCIHVYEDESFANYFCAMYRNCYSNLKISKALLKSQAHQNTSLFTSTAKNQRGFPKGVKRSSGPISRIPGGERVAVKVGVVQMGRVNDLKHEISHRFQ